MNNSRRIYGKRNEIIGESGLSIGKKKIGDLRESMSCCSWCPK